MSQTLAPTLGDVLVAAGRPTTDAMVDGFDHGACTLTFCRNPLHPGPCKGWRDHLRRNAPGVARALDRVDADRREARRKANAPASVPAQTPAGITRRQADGLESIGRLGAGGAPLRYVSPQTRKKLADAGLIEERPGEGGRPHMFLTPKGQAIVDARNGARREAQRRLEERAVAEGLDPLDARIGGLPAARRRKRERDAAAVRMRAEDVERGAPEAPNNNDPRGILAGPGEGRESLAAFSHQRKIIQEMRKAGIDVNDDVKGRLGPVYQKYVNSIDDLSGRRRNAQRWADRLAFFQDARDSDPDLAADYDAKIAEAKAGYDEAVRLLGEAKIAADNARADAGSAIVAEYGAIGKRKSVAALKLPETGDGSPPDPGRRLAADGDEAVGRLADGPDTPAVGKLRRAAIARSRQERELADLERRYKAGERDASYDANSRELNSPVPAIRAEAVRKLEAGRASQSKLFDRIEAAKKRLGERRDAETEARRELIAVRDAEREEGLQAERERANRPETRARAALVRAEGSELERGRAFATRLEAGEDPRIIAGEVRQRLAALEAFKKTERWQRLGPFPRSEVVRTQSQYREAVRQLDSMPAPPGNAAYDPLDRIAGDDEAPLAANIRARIERGDDRAGLIAELRARAKEMDSVSRRTKTVGAEERNAATRNRGIYMGIIKELERGGVSASAPAVQLADDLAHGRRTWDFPLAGGRPGRPEVRPAAPALVAALTSLTLAHWECTDEFCLNGTMPGEKKVHPGPCRGWKEALRRVAPGALEIIEAERKRKLAERKAGKTPARKATGRRPAKPKPPPEPERLVRLSPETLRLADEVARELPRDEAGWHAMVNRREVGGRRLVEMEMDNLRERMDRERPNYEKALAAARTQVRRQRPPAERGRRTMTEQEERDVREAVRFDRRLGGVDYVRAETRLREVEAIEATIQRKLAAGQPLDYGEQHMNNTGPSIVRAEYPIDPNGVRLPPEPLRHAEERVRQMGRALHQDIRDALADHPDVRAAQAEYDAANEQYRLTRSFESRQRLVATDQALTRTTNQTRHAMVLDALSQIRPMGGQRHTNLDVVQGSNDADRDNGRADWRERMAVGDQHFPDDWVAASSRARLTVASSNRAWHRASGGGWEETSDPAQRYSMLAMTSEHEERRARGTRDRPAAPYGGGFADRVDEVTVHELGHRMEQQIPGLQALEFAWLRAHTSQAGTVERQVSLRDVAHSGYGAHEVAYRDSFNNAYTGRTYERGPADPDPAARPWEVFQVGLQQTFGSESRFGPNSLADFTLGALATLGRTDLD